MQAYLREAGTLWSQAKDIKDQIYLQSVYRGLGKCPVMNYLGVRASIATAGMETQAAVTAMFKDNWTDEIGSVIQESRHADVYAAGLISQGLHIEPKNFDIFGKLRTAIIGTASRDGTKKMCENL